MSGKRISIAVVMKLTAIVAVNLTVIRFAPVMLWDAPPFVFLIVLLDMALVQAGVFGLPLGTFYFTFLGAGVISTGVVTILAIRQANSVPGSLHILETAILHYRAGRGLNRGGSLYVEFPMLATAERWLTCLLGALPATAAAVLAVRWKRLRSWQRSVWGQTVGAFFQGALIGVAVYGAGVIVANWLFDLNKYEQQVKSMMLVCLISCPIVGALLVAMSTRRTLQANQRSSDEPDSGHTEAGA